MGRSIAVNDPFPFTGRFQRGDSVIAVGLTPIDRDPPRGTIWAVMPSRSGYLVRWSAGAITGKHERDLAPTGITYGKLAWRWIRSKLQR